LHSICESQRVADHEQGLRLGLDGIQGGRNIGRQFDFHGGRIEPKRLSGLYDFPQLKSGIGNASITQNGQPPQFGDYLAKKERFWVLRFKALMVKRGPWLRPQASEGVSGVGRDRSSIRQRSVGGRSAGEGRQGSMKPEGGAARGNMPMK
jgi:hypothetical protein